MDSQSILDLAKQGDPSAIAALINSSLKSKGIIAKVTKKEDCLRVILESQKILNQESLVKIIHKELSSLAIESINYAMIYARQSENSPTAWSERLSLSTTEPLNMPEFSPPMDAETSQKLKKQERKRQMEFSLVFWGLIFLIGGCAVYVSGSPWTCQQAEDAVKEAQRDLDGAFRKNLDGERIYKYSYILSNKQGLRDRKCGD
ncbi:hypothetical protein JYQ62_22115 [Nostoc sp. UHCC 0702]|nr:hypothetical protein JYQ62_22115 [Nostoc sp. UHCC 0702]